MTDNGNRQPTIVRTERGLTVGGTRLTLYQIMDYVVAGWPQEQIGELHSLTEAQMADIMRYIEQHRAEVEAEYQQVLEYAEEERRYWEERNRERFAQIAAMPPRTDHPELRARLAALRAKREQS